MYWGEPDASVSFCENKYEVTQYIAEYYNTMSAFSYMIVGIIFYFTKLRYISNVLLLMSLGTMVLHGTLRYYGQWMDEISMIILSFYIIKYLRNDLFKNNTHNMYLCGIITGYFLFNKFFIYFFVMFSGMQFYIYRLAQIKRNKKNRVENILIKAYTVSLIGATVCWFIDQIACEYVGYFQFHAIWHVGTALAMLFGFTAIII
tara:strand:- start:693 stop:1301 length:609 start_codon:yes stop_codon:yes gene_type:complete